MSRAVHNQIGKISLFSVKDLLAGCLNLRVPIESSGPLTSTDAVACDNVLLFICIVRIRNLVVCHMKIQIPVYCIFAIAASITISQHLCKLHICLHKKCHFLNPVIVSHPYAVSLVDHLCISRVFRIQLIMIDGKTTTKCLRYLSFIACHASVRRGQGFG
jgi:hypothetical protein